MPKGEVERKLATILSADVAGYSRLMGTDEEGTLKALSASREVMDGLVARHRGRVFGSAGESIIAEFASPVEAVAARSRFRTRSLRGTPSGTRPGACAFASASTWAT